MERRNFLKLSAGACLVSALPLKSDFMVNKKVLLITGEVNDIESVMPKKEDEIKSNVKEIYFSDLKDGNVFMLENTIQYKNEPRHFDGPFLAKGNAFITEGTNGKKTHGIMCESYNKYLTK